MATEGGRGSTAHHNTDGEDDYVHDRDLAQFCKDGSSSREFTNERGNRICMEVKAAGDDTIRIVAHGPTSTCDHTWTHGELQILIQLVSINTRLRQEVDDRTAVTPRLAVTPADS